MVAETDAADGIRKVFIGGTDAMKFWLVKLVVADMIQYLSNKQVNLGLYFSISGCGVASLLGRLPVARY